MSDRPKIHLVGNAHLDPAWMWPLEEGLSAFAATCRSALDRIDEYPDLIFTCSSAAHYEYIEQTDPELFLRIQDALERGSWCIVGGWWVEADCNIPSGESLIRQALLGQRYFASRFGRIATVGYNIDSFGHNANLPALLRGAGIEYYVFMRPEEHELSLSDTLFEWRSPSGASVTAYRLPLHYSNHQYDIRTKLSLLPDYPHFRSDRDWMIFFGVGNHGGGPTIEQLEQIRDEQRNRSDLALSDPVRFFQSVKPSLTLQREMNPHAVGAYSANALLKKLHRYAENALDRAERMLVMRGSVISGFSTVRLDHAWKDLCLTEFHDLLGGVSIQEATEEAIGLLEQAVTTAERSARLDRQRVASRIDTSNAIQNLIVFNDSGYDRTEYIEFELWHPHASERGDILRSVTLEASDGTRIPCQKIEPSGKIGEDRVRWLARVSVPSFGWQTFAVREQESEAVNTAAHDASLEMQLLVSHDEADTWAHGLTTYLPAFGAFEVLDTVPIESGPLRKVTRTHLKWRSSRAEIEVFSYLNDETIEVRIMLDWHEPDQTVILALPHNITDPSVIYEIPYASIERPADGKEYPGQTWLDVRDKSGHGVALVNDSKYSFGVDQENIYITLARSKPYAYHVPPHTLSEHERVRYLDHGVQECRFLVLKHATSVAPSELQRLSDRLNKPLFVHHESQHSGHLSRADSLLLLDTPGIRVGAIKPSEEESDVIIRIVELNGRETTTELRGRIASADVTMSPYEIKTLRIVGDGVVPVDFLERPL